MPSLYSPARRDCLQAMGLTLYVARYPLPGAAPSLPMDDDPPVVDTASLVETREPDEPGGAGRRLPADLLGTVSRGTAPDHDPGPTAVPSPQADAATATPTLPAPFTLAAVTLGGALWLEELPDAVLGRDQVALMRAICRALDWPMTEVVVNQFAWPMHRNPQFDQGAEAARAALSAFVQRQLEAGQCARLVLLGESARDRLDGLSGEARVLAIPSTRDMLRQPLLKREAWHALRRCQANALR